MAIDGGVGVFVRGKALTGWLWHSARDGGEAILSAPGQILGILGEIPGLIYGLLWGIYGLVGSILGGLHMYMNEVFLGPIGMVTNAYGYPFVLIWHTFS